MGGIIGRIMIFVLMGAYCVKMAESVDPLQLINQSLEDILKRYFYTNYSYSDILYFLSAFHGVVITERHLNRLLRKFNLYRRRAHAPLHITFQIIRNELMGSASCRGYRFLHQKLRQQGIIVDRETVRITIKALDPEGVATRSARRLRRRLYKCTGSNQIWHIDGYDKLKPYGLPIHGAIDGFSRKILWLEVGASNNDPKVIANYFLNTIKELKAGPGVVRADRGTENVHVAGIQRFFRRNHRDSLSGHKSFRFGTSTTNQRIEALWSQLRRFVMNWWINYFKDLIDNTEVDTSLNHHKEALRFCFLGLLQDDLDESRNTWNQHRIRRVNNSECPAGIPNIIYYAPERFGGTEEGRVVDINDMEAAKEFAAPSPTLGCSLEFVQLSSMIMEERLLDMPRNVEEAKNLLNILLSEIDGLN